ncbi:MAG: type II secretion system F family protein [Woeseiaceae bacterium]
MSVFAYTARDRQRKSVQGEVEGRGRDEVADYLLDQGLTPITIFERKVAGETVAALRRRLSAGPQLVDLIFFCRQMFSICKAGLALHRGVRTLTQSVRNPVLRAALADVRRQIEEGRTLSEGMSAHRGVFPPLMINLVRVGENTGRLDQAFSELQRNLELEHETRRRMKAAMRYPILVVFALVIALSVVTLFVIPVFAGVFADFGAELPWMTRVLMATSDWALAWWPYVAAGGIALFATARSWLKTEKGAELWGRWSLRTPVFGQVLLKATLARFSRTLAMCMRSGIVLDQAVQAVAAASNNRHFALRLAAMRERIAQGESLTSAARHAALFTPLVMQMIATGEETGRLDEMLEECGAFYEREVDYDVGMLGEYVEPVLLVIVSVLVLMLALGIFLPMWDLASVALDR